MVRLAESRQVGEEMLQSVKVPVTVGIIHRLQAILRAEAVGRVGSDKNTVQVLTCPRAAPDQSTPDCLNWLLWDSDAGSQQDVEVPRDAYTI